MPPPGGDMPPPGGDDDRDGVPNGRDNCPRDENPSQRDADADGTGDACDDGDTDLDGVPDRDDLCPAADLRPVDADGDGLGDQCDNCPDVPNEGQVDVDGDGRGDACEDLNDLDEDGVPLGTDNCENLANSDQLDADGDGRGDTCDGCPNAPDFSQRDRDGDGVGDACDPCPDEGGDPAAQADFDGDGVAACAGDCDDDDPRVSPGAMERCNGGDDDCDLNVDETFLDLGTACQAGIGACQRPGVLVCGDDAGVVCNAAAGAARAEVCNEVDDDCDGRVDDGLAGCCQPGDQVPCGSEVGECSPGVQVCGNDRSYGACNDVGPASEVCNNRDDDCDATTDEGFDLTSDGANCGRCGNACPAGQRCFQGACQAGGGPVRNRLLVCGTVERDLEDLLQGQNVGLRIESGCTPNARTQAMLFPREPRPARVVDWNAVGAWVRAGGQIITEWSSSVAAYNRLTGSNVQMAGLAQGGCDNVVMPRVQRSPADPFWLDNPHVPPAAADDGCGYPLPVARMPGVVTLGAFDANNISLAYLDLGLGRLWLVESDWQDLPVFGIDLGPTDRLLAYMIAGGRAGVAPTACNNGIDDDADGYFDLDDRGCDALEDLTEGNWVGNPPQCSNDRDDDFDGLTDFPYDAGCTHAADLQEGAAPAMPACNNGLDDDRDGNVDFPSDLECQGAAGVDEDPPARFVHCNDRLDNDGDSFVDLDDPDCAFGIDGSEGRFVPAAACNNGIDDDGDGRADAFDPGCGNAQDDSELDGAVAPECSNGRDDDADGRVDYPNDAQCVAAGDGCERAGREFCGGACRNLDDDEAHCGRCNTACAPGAECVAGRCDGLFTFNGVLQGAAAADLDGWRVCFSDRYADQSPRAVETILQNCDGAFVMYGCRPVGSPTYSLLAMGPRALVFTDTGAVGNAVTTTNGVSFYFSPNYSLGFVPEGELPNRNSCDTGNVRGEERMCWHTQFDGLNTGYRCGNEFLNGNVGWERVVLTGP